MSDEKVKRPSSVAKSPAAKIPSAKGPAGSVLAKRDGADGDDEEKSPGPLRWALGWIVLPGAVVAGIVGAGALVGAHFHDSWFTRAIVWVVDLF